MSAGELESERAGEPGRLIRDRYRTASQVIQNQGKMSCLMINDIDAGLGRFGNTQMTVNNQIVVGTLMNLSDNPTRVSIGQNWRESDITNRIPIIVTGNDFSTLYAPLVRDGRMDKFYWFVALDKGWVLVRMKVMVRTVRRDLHPWINPNRREPIRSTLMRYAGSILLKRNPWDVLGLKNDQGLMNLMGLLEYGLFIVGFLLFMFPVRQNSEDLQLNNWVKTYRTLQEKN